jgi:hypothetical protein
LYTESSVDLCGVDGCGWNTRDEGQGINAARPSSRQAAAYVLAARLQEEGAKSFINSWNELMNVIKSKRAVLKKAG